MFCVFQMSLFGNCSLYGKSFAEHVASSRFHGKPKEDEIERILDKRILASSYDHSVHENDVITSFGIFCMSGCVF